MSMNRRWINIKSVTLSASIHSEKLGFFKIILNNLVVVSEIQWLIISSVLGDFGKHEFIINILDTWHPDFHIKHFLLISYLAY